MRVDAARATAGRAKQQRLSTDKSTRVHSGEGCLRAGRCRQRLAMRGTRLQQQQQQLPEEALQRWRSRRRAERAASAATAVVLVAVAVVAATWALPPVAAAPLPLTVAFTRSLFGTDQTVDGENKECAMATEQETAAAKAATGLPDEDFVGANRAPDCAVDGECRPCSGGAAVRQFVMDTLAAEAPNLVRISVGAHYFGSKSYHVLGHTYAARMFDGIDVLGIDNADLFGSAHELSEFARATDAALVCSNLELDAAAEGVEDFPLWDPRPGMDTSEHPQRAHLLQPWHVLHRGGRKVGVIAAAPSAIRSRGMSHEDAQYLIVEQDATRAVRRAVFSMTSAHPDVSIVIVASNLNAAENRAVAENVIGVDVVLGAPVDTTPWPIPPEIVTSQVTDQPVLLMDAPEFGTGIAVLELTFDDAGVLTEWSEAAPRPLKLSMVGSPGAYVIANRQYSNDDGEGSPGALMSTLELRSDTALLQDMIVAAAAVEASLGEVVGHIAVPMNGDETDESHFLYYDHQDLQSDEILELNCSARASQNVTNFHCNAGCRVSDCPMGRFFADAALRACPAELNCDAALINVGSIRGSFNAAGGITRADVRTVFFFSGELVAVDLTGTQLLAVLEHAVDGFLTQVSRNVLDLDGKFLAVSGLSFAWNPAATNNTNEKAILYVRVGSGDASHVLDPTRVYKVVMPRFMATGGDGYNRDNGVVIDVADEDLLLLRLTEALIATLGEDDEYVVPGGADLSACLGFHANTERILDGTCRVIMGQSHFYRHPAAVALGVVVHDRDSQLQAVVAHLAAEAVNADGAMLPQTAVDVVWEPADEERGGVVGAMSRLNERGVVGIVGPASSTAAISMAALANELRLPVISPLATAPVLSDVVQFPLFFRTVPSDAAQAAAIAAMVRHMGWRRVALAYVVNDYGQGFRQAFLAAAAGDDTGAGIIDVEPQVPVQTGAASFDFGAGELAAAATQVIVLCVTEMEMNAVVRDADAASLFSPGHAWLVTDGVSAHIVASSLGDGDQTLHNILDASDGMVAVRPQPGNTAALSVVQEAWDARRDTDTVVGVVAGTGTALFAATGASAWDLLSNDFDRVLSPGSLQSNQGAYAAYDAVLAFASALDDLVEQRHDVSDGDALAAQVASVSVDGSSGRVAFDDNGDRISSFQVVNVHSLPLSFVPFAVVSEAGIVSQDPLVTVRWSGGEVAKPTDSLVRYTNTDGSPRCLYDVVPARVRTARTIRLETGPWRAQRFVTAAARLLLEEALGYQVNVTQRPLDTVATARARVDTGDADANLVLWPDVTRMRARDDSLDLVGRIGWYVSSAALRAAGVRPLEFFGFYSDRSGLDVDVSLVPLDPSIPLCAETCSFEQGRTLTRCVLPCFESAAVASASGLRTPLCHQPNNCAVIFVGALPDSDEAETVRQQVSAIRFRDVALVFVGTDASMPRAAAKLKHTVLMVWRTPSVVVDAGGAEWTPMTLPLHSDECWSKRSGGVAAGVDCDFPVSVPLLAAIAPQQLWSDDLADAYVFLRAASISNSDVVLVGGEFDAVEEAACRWVRTQSDSWRAWVTDTRVLPPILKLDVPEPGWSSHRMSSAIFAAVAQRALGYEVERVAAPTTGFARRLSQGDVHVNVEVWRNRREQEFQQHEESVTSAPLGYPGREGVFSSVGRGGGAGQLHWKHLLPEAEADGIERAADLLPATMDGSYLCVSTDDEEVVGTELSGEDEFAPEQHGWCRLGEYSRCPSDGGTSADLCWQVLHMHPAYATGVVEAMAKANDIPARVTYVGQRRLEEHAHLSSEQGRRTLFYHWTPSEFMSRLGNQFARVAFPPYRDGCASGSSSMAAEGDWQEDSTSLSSFDCDFPTVELSKVWSPLHAARLPNYGSYLIETFNISESTMSLLLSSLEESTDDAIEAAAQQWVDEHHHVWGWWIAGCTDVQAVNYNEHALVSVPESCEVPVDDLSLLLPFFLPLFVFGFVLLLLLGWVWYTLPKPPDPKQAAELQRVVDSISAARQRQRRDKLSFTLSRSDLSSDAPKEPDGKRRKATRRRFRGTAASASMDEETQSPGRLLETLPHAEQVSMLKASYALWSALARNPKPAKDDNIGNVRVARFLYELYFSRVVPYATLFKLIALAHCMLAFFEPPHADTPVSDPFGQVMRMRLIGVETFFLFLYGADVFLRVVIESKGGFLGQTRNVLYLISIVVLGIDLVVAASATLGGEPSLRFSRPLRPLLFIVRVRIIRRAFRLVATTLWGVLDAIALIVMLLLSYAIVGALNYGHASDPETGYRCPLCFDTYPRSFLQFFLFAAGEQKAAHPSIAANHTDLGVLSYIFFASFSVCAIVVVNVLLARVFEEFKKARQKLGDSDRKRLRQTLKQCFNHLTQGMPEGQRFVSKDKWHTMMRIVSGAGRGCCVCRRGAYILLRQAVVYDAVDTDSNNALNFAEFSKVVAVLQSRVSFVHIEPQSTLITCNYSAPPPDAAIRHLPPMSPHHANQLSQIQRAKENEQAFASVTWRSASVRSVNIELWRVMPRTSIGNIVRQLGFGRAQRSSQAVIPPPPSMLSPTAEAHGDGVIAGTDDEMDSVARFAQALVAPEEAKEDVTASAQEDDDTDADVDRLSHESPDNASLGARELVPPPSIASATSGDDVAIDGAAVDDAEAPAADAAMEAGNPATNGLGTEVSPAHARDEHPVESAPPVGDGGGQRATDADAAEESKLELADLTLTMGRLVGEQGADVDPEADEALLQEESERPVGRYEYIATIRRGVPAVSWKVEGDAALQRKASFLKRSATIASGAVVTRLCCNCRLRHRHGVDKITMGHWAGGIPARVPPGKYTLRVVEEESAATTRAQWSSDDADWDNTERKETVPLGLHSFGHVNTIEREIVPKRDALHADIGKIAAENAIAWWFEVAVAPILSVLHFGLMTQYAADSALSREEVDQIDNVFAALASAELLGYLIWTCVEERGSAHDFDVVSVWLTFKKLWGRNIVDIFITLLSSPVMWTVEALGAPVSWSRNLRAIRFLRILFNMNRLIARMKGASSVYHRWLHGLGEKLNTSYMQMALRRSIIVLPQMTSVWLVFAYIWSMLGTEFLHGMAVCKLKEPRGDGGLSLLTWFFSATNCEPNVPGADPEANLADLNFETPMRGMWTLWDLAVVFNDWAALVQVTMLHTGSDASALYIVFFIGMTAWILLNIITAQVIELVEMMREGYLAGKLNVKVQVAHMQYGKSLTCLRLTRRAHIDGADTEVYAEWDVVKLARRKNAPAGSRDFSHTGTLSWSGMLPAERRGSGDASGHLAAGGADLGAVAGGEELPRDGSSKFDTEEVATAVRVDLDKPDDLGVG